MDHEENFSKKYKISECLNNESYRITRSKKQY